MKFAFDLISDLHVESWDGFDWSGQATSPFCVLAGDVARDYNQLEDTLEHLGECYQAVFYIDGNDEHKDCWEDMGGNYKNIAHIAEYTSGIVYLQDNVVIINGVAILGTNGWWTWDTDLTAGIEYTKTWFSEHYNISSYVPRVIDRLAENDVQYLTASLARLQTMPDVKRVVMVTHTVPGSDLVAHDIDLDGTYRLNCMCNNDIRSILEVDTERKVSHWCFGHYHGHVDRMIDGVRYVNNCRGKKDTPYNKSVYFPLRIEVDF